MEVAKEQAKARVSALVEKFTRLKADGKLRDLNESDTKAAFIEPLFESLGWSVRDLDEVAREKQVLRGRADYAFKLSSTIRFFVEAKAVPVLLDEKDARQAINYAYLKSVSWAVLTNFEKLVLYNSEWKASRSEESRFLLFEKPDDYLTHFDDLWLLSKSAFLAGALDEHAEKYGRKAKREPVTKALFRDFMRWRSLIAKSVVSHDPRRKLTPENVDEGVQRFLNRLVFIRTCEDRGIENELLRALVREWKEGGKRRLTSHLHDLFTDFNTVYDSDLFAPHLAGELLVDDSVLEQVLNELYENPDGVHYKFSDIPADVLGTIYEQYLATILRKTGGLAEKEANRKEMGIYYTPTYIVDYIVKNTLGELTAKAKRAEDLEKIKVLDPACGSGSFLIKAYETLYEAYQKKNNGDQEILGENVSKNAYSVLTKNLHGVDLDAKAVEIAELNLLLHAVRRRGLLPPLSDNIKQGNSLISGTQEQLEKHFGKKWKEKHPFNWETEYEQTMKNGGFDVIIGNPPYVSVKVLPSDEKQYFIDTFDSATGQFDLYGLFIERSIRLLREGGLFGFITSNTYLSNKHFKKLREFILKNTKIRAIANLGESVFKDAHLDVAIILLEKCGDDKKREANSFVVFQNVEEFRANNGTEVPQKTFAASENYEFKINITHSDAKLFKKLKETSVPLGAIVEITRGIERGSNDKDISDKQVNNSYKKVLVGKDIARYCITFAGRHIKYQRDNESDFKTSRIFEAEKILVQRIRNLSLKRRLVATLDGENYYM
ncbi:N-6 DNA methylase [Candidatus Micrarchaeota archaeon]|nr:N-6 DNA methylase [Candidatus Micrarchaeota archaeon]